MQLQFFTEHTHTQPSHLHAVDHDSDGQDGVKEAEVARGRRGSGRVECWVADHNAVRKTQT